MAPFEDRDFYRGPHASKIRTRERCVIKAGRTEGLGGWSSSDKYKCIIWTRSPGYLHKLRSLSLIKFLFIQKSYLIQKEIYEVRRAFVKYSRECRVRNSECYSHKKRRIHGETQIIGYHKGRDDVCARSVRA
jgi:hypothetical protein